MITDAIMPILVTLSTIFLTLCAIALYFTPTIFAIKRKHPNKYPIILLNVLLGGTVIGWAIALILASGGIQYKKPQTGELFRCFSCKKTFTQAEIKVRGIMNELIDDEMRYQSTKYIDQCPHCNVISFLGFNAVEDTEA